MFKWFEGPEVMLDQIIGILLLQQKYSSANTPDMERRGVVIRNELPESMKQYWHDLVKAMPDPSVRF